MILFWSICAVMTAIVVGALLTPLLRARAAAARESGERRGLAVYRDQLAEIERDRQRGLLDDDQAEAARLEVERRLLTIAGPEDGQTASEGATGTSAVAGGAGPWLAAAVAVLVPAAALGLYVWLGTPGQPGQPFAERQAAAPMGDMVGLAERLAARLDQGGGSADDWSLLARTYGQIGRPGQAASAAAEAIRLGLDDAETQSFRGEMLTIAANGEVTAEARRAFARALEHSAGNPRALYYSGLALAQDGQLERAMKLWTTLAEASGPDAPWLGLLRQQIQRVAADLGVEPPEIATGEAPPPGPVPGEGAGGTGAPPMAGGVPPSGAGGARGPSQADVAAAQSMTSDERMAFIRSMVAGLAERLEGSPDDLDGWLRLTRAYTVLNEREKAAEALAKAEALADVLPEDAPERAAVEAARKALDAGG